MGIGQIGRVNRCASWSLSLEVIERDFLEAKIVGFPASLNSLYWGCD